MTRPILPLDRVNVALAVATASVLTAGILGWGSSLAAGPSGPPGPSTAATSPRAEKTNGPVKTSGAAKPSTSPKAVAAAPDLGRWRIGGAPPSGPDMEEEPCGDGRSIVRLYEGNPTRIIEAVVAGKKITALHTATAGYPVAGGGEVGWSRDRLTATYQVKESQQGWVLTKGDRHVFFARFDRQVESITVWATTAGPATPKFNCGG